MPPPAAAAVGEVMSPGAGGGGEDEGEEASSELESANCAAMMGCAARGVIGPAAEADADAAVAVAVAAAASITAFACGEGSAGDVGRGLERSAEDAGERGEFVGLLLLLSDAASVVAGLPPLMLESAAAAPNEVAAPPRPVPAPAAGDPAMGESTVPMKLGDSSSVPSLLSLRLSLRLGGLLRLAVRLMLAVVTLGSGSAGPPAPPTAATVPASPAAPPEDSIREPLNSDGSIASNTSPYDTTTK